MTLPDPNFLMRQYGNVVNLDTRASPHAGLLVARRQR